MPSPVFFHGHVVVVNRRDVKGRWETVREQV
jgi:hypothetical protein